MPLKREHGQEHPYWPLGPFKVRLPFIHYRWEFPEMIQAFIMFVVSLGMIPLLQQYLGLPYEAALAGVVVCGIGFMLPALLGVPMVPGWITPAIPVTLLYLQSFEPGPEAIKAMIALQVIVFLIFLILGITGLGSKLVNAIPNSLKCGVIIGAGIAAMMGELKAGGRVEGAPISIILGAIIAAYILFSLSFKNVVLRNAFAKQISNFGMVPGIVIAMIVGWSLGEFALPNIEWGVTQPDFGLLYAHLGFSVGWPTASMFLLAVPTAIIAYVIAFGDILVGSTLIKRAEHQRPDETVEINVTRVHLVTAIRNAIHALFAPWPGLAGPLWTPIQASTAERYALGRKSMDSIYSGQGTFWISGFLALFVLPLVTMFKPVLPLALSLTMILTAYICIMVGMEELKNSAERGVAGIVAVTLTMPDPRATIYAIVVGVVLYLLIERTNAAARDEGDLSIISDNTAAIEAGSSDGVAAPNQKTSS
ncbi:solute carrier family 23 protein [Vitreoscilla stercoraria]|uniref:Xanthine/uracil/vitamin C permease n=1 Tax=Vitreoscilla stercoraria TaxID=61 RepID=A0ABY4EB16_VITST|nr:solute carrier family 23 protein [Vitreoscilla stercoraria]UOO92948.1 xanthine/uracil/vitamin C permease [Vitreoscilla stercoraria]